MYFKLFVLLAVAAGVSHSAAIASQGTHIGVVQLLKNAYLKYIKEHQLEDNTDQLITFMMDYANAVTTWLSKIHDTSSVEYKDFVAAHHGNTEISTDEEQLRQEFYDLYGKKVIEKSLKKTFSKQISSMSQEQNHSSVNELSQNSVSVSKEESVKSHESKQTSKTSSYKKESSQLNSQQSQTNIQNLSNVSHQKSSSEKSVSKQESEYSMTGSSLDKQQVYGYNAGNTQGHGEVSTESSSVNSNAISNNKYQNSVESMDQKENLNKLSENVGTVSKVEESNSFQVASQSSSAHKEELSQNNSQQSQTNIENLSNVSHQESSSKNSAVHQTHEVSNGIHLSSEEQFVSNNIASNSESKHESEYSMSGSSMSGSSMSGSSMSGSSMSGSSLNKEQVYGYNGGYSEGQGEVISESSGSYGQNNQNLYGSSNNNNDVSNNNYHNFDENVNKQETVSEFSHHEDNSLFHNLRSNVAQFAKATVNQVATKKLTQQQSQQELLRAHNAHYSFANTADNNIEGNYLQRMETRKDGKVYGRYSYDDGNFFVTRYYFADENGFRIVKEFNEPSKKKGHQLNGEANVDFVSEGATRGYHITGQDIHKCQDSIKRVPYERAEEQVAVA